MIYLDPERLPPFPPGPELRREADQHFSLARAYNSVHAEDHGKEGRTHRRHRPPAPPLRRPLDHLGRHSISDRLREPGTEHLLLGLLGERNGKGGSILVPFSDGPLERDLLPWILRSHAFEILNERFLPVGDFGIVLPVRMTLHSARPLQRACTG